MIIWSEVSVSTFLSSSQPENYLRFIYKTILASVQRIELEGDAHGLIILDLNLGSEFRIINVYGVFNPQDGATQSTIQ